MHRGANNSAGVPVVKCGDVANALEDGLPDGYKFNGGTVTAGQWSGVMLIPQLLPKLR